MATLYISEFAGQGRDAGGYITEAVMVPPIADQAVTIGASSTQSAAVNAATVIVRLNTDAACSIAIGTNPTATATKLRMSANATEYFTIPAGQSYKIAVITNT